ncbi:MAG TPA: PLP-dependent transferase, partial [Candidatus Dormibacteraeota bacterium]|nr:PLP-dependent transferase [Candidatus Dormibacteraeota bacterium]
MAEAPPGPGRALDVTTRAVHVGLGPDGATGAIAPPIVTSSIYEHGHPSGYVYGREHNPTWERLEAALADLEAGAGALALPSGMTALTAVVQQVPLGGRVVAPAGS